MEMQGDSQLWSPGLQPALEGDWECPGTQTRHVSPPRLLPGRGFGLRLLRVLCHSELALSADGLLPALHTLTFPPSIVCPF